MVKPAFVTDCEEAVDALIADTADGGPPPLPLARRSGAHRACTTGW